MHLIHPLRHGRRVYCAGPLFNAAERREMLQIAAVLSAAGYEPFVPHADGLEFAQVLPELEAAGYAHAEAGRLLHTAVFALDVYQTAVGCGALVMNLNGRVPDEGAVAEATLAWALGKPVVIYKEDVRSKIAGRDNPLVVGQTGFETVATLEAIPQRLAELQGAWELEPAWATPAPPALSQAIVAGGRLWEALQRLGQERPAPQIAQIVRALFAPESLACLQ